MSPATPAILFDLDGTLIDSAPSILQSFAAALAQHGLQAQEPLGPHLIGPPLHAALQRITGVADAGCLAELAHTFKQHYDTAGYQASTVYPGVHQVLHALRAQGVLMAIVTNKRIHPTRLIIQHLGWQHLFAGVYAADAFTPALPGKAATISQALQLHGLQAHQACYVGDRSEDAEAATTAGLRFVWAPWGYMPDLDISPWPGARCCRTPEEWLALATSPTIVTPQPHQTP
jgi:phosphoglycolate phosphatase